MADLMGDAFNIIAGFAIVDGSKRILTGKRTDDKVEGAVEVFWGVVIHLIAEG